jgi:hypothetical protein
VCRESERRSWCVSVTAVTFDGAGLRPRVRAYCFHDFDTVCDQPTLKLLNVYSSLVLSGVVLGEDVRIIRVLGQVQVRLNTKEWFNVQASSMSR